MEAVSLGPSTVLSRDPRNIRLEVCTEIRADVHCVHFCALETGGHVHFCALKQEFGHDNGGVLGHRVSLKSSLKHFGGSQKGKRQLLYFVQ